MVKIISGKKGSGKTKLLIEAIHAAAAKSGGNVVAIQKGTELNLDIDHKVRLINIDDYKVTTPPALYGFVAGILASDYDCTDIFVDGTLRIVGRDAEALVPVLDAISDVSGSAVVTLTVSEDADTLPAGVKQYF
ncbi:hypothetical protein FACS1894120_1600 [Clostridia bacterium]|nr:hypothetical protein FACS1894120_1600 [Clostridia bacterium]